jgi:hypothetical protein
VNTYRIEFKDDASPGIRRALASTKGSQILGAMGTAVKRGVQDHLLARPSNKMGWPTTNFYKRAARATTFAMDGKTSAVVSVNHLGITQRYYGGTIKPVKAKKLTIPARPEAYGKRAREFSNLVLAFGRRGPFALVEAHSQEVSFGRQRKDGSRAVKQGAIVGGGVLFWLVDSVHQDPDHSVLPTEAKTAEMAVAAGEAFIAREERREATT